MLHASAAAAGRRGSREAARRRRPGRRSKRWRGVGASEHAWVPGAPAPPASPRCARTGTRKRAAPGRAARRWGARRQARVWRRGASGRAAAGPSAGANGSTLYPRARPAHVVARRRVAAARDASGHGVRLARARLAVGKHRRVVAAEAVVHDRRADGCGGRGAGGGRRAWAGVSRGCGSGLLPRRSRARAERHGGPHRRPTDAREPAARLAPPSASGRRPASPRGPPRGPPAHSRRRRPGAPSPAAPRRTQSGRGRAPAG
jgi:hypothetical protein